MKKLSWERIFSLKNLLITVISLLLIEGSFLAGSLFGSQEKSIVSDCPVCPKVKGETISETKCPECEECPTPAECKPIIKEVIKTKEIPKEVIKIKEVPKEVIKTVEVPKEMIKEVEIKVYPNQQAVIDLVECGNDIVNNHTESMSLTNNLMNATMKSDVEWSKRIFANMQTNDAEFSNLAGKWANLVGEVFKK